MSFKYIFNFLKKVKGIAMFKIGQSNENFVVKFYYEFQRSKGFLLFFFEESPIVIRIPIKIDLIF